MMSIIVSMIRSLGIKDGIIAILIVAVGFTAQMWHRATVDFMTAALVYEHPSYKTMERIVYKEGPVRIITKIKEVPGGGKETLIEETRDAVTQEIATGHESAPMPASIALAPARTDRYLLTLGVNRLSMNFEGKALFVGYGWKNRLDIQIGGIERDGFSPWILTSFRF